MDKTLLSESKPRPSFVWVRVAGVIGALFGLMTIREGGAVLFVDGPARVAAGDCYCARAHSDHTI